MYMYYVFKNGIAITLIAVFFTSIINKWYFMSVHIVCDKITKQKKEVYSKV